MLRLCPRKQLGALGSTGRRIVLRPAISLSLWFVWRVQNAIYHGSAYSKSAGDEDELSEEEEMSFTRIEDAAVAFRNAQ
jgi:hypothetical protein